MKNKNKQTKFPVARIKKIMQKDEEVGKVAQATPVVISKALELFLALIVEEASKVTSERGSKKVEAYHLKHAIETTETLDFLKEIVESVPDPSAGGTIDLETDALEGKKRRGKGKKSAAAAAAAASGSAGTTGEPGAAPVKRRRRKKGEVVQQEETGMDGEGFETKSEPEPEHDQEGDVAMRDENLPQNGRREYARDRSASQGDNDWDNNKPYLPRR
ncbi:hypothetical protein AMATHDRAFT_62768 [Amanita thiersii Skay4041]|uniref:Transcription factor CBF/NF-Y/archaeal histone domain-containing protein n=1 Tax=Amanita thiersii Skay4041 TaxID=703135 RepID=A0A2A9NPN4_9AGAR|nr:hypothetical protein AMATHDRAFT_62768 [Amanita thiersii Skay4041]